MSNSSWNDTKEQAAHRAAIVEALEAFLDAAKTVSYHALVVDGKYEDGLYGDTHTFVIREK